MATVPAKDEKQTIASKVAAAGSRARLIVALMALGALTALAPVPYGAFGAALVALVAYELGRVKR